MFARIAAFELRYQLRSPWLWVAAAFVFGIAAFSMSTDLIEGGEIYRNASWEILNKYLGFSAMFMFVSTAFLANVVIRDDETGFGPILRSTRIGKADYLIGRFAGAFAVVSLCLLLIPAGLLAGSVMPWVDPATIGPNRIADHLYGYFLLALPNVLIVSAILFTLASLTRSAMGIYVGVVGFVILYLMLNEALISRPQLVGWVSLAEPFGRRAVLDSTRYWTLLERNTLLPALEGPLLWNRLLWVGISVLFLSFAAWRYRFADKPTSERARRRAAPQPPADEASFARPLRLPSPSHGLAASWAVLRARIRFEMKQVVVSPAFPLMILWGMSTTLLVLLTQRDMDGRPSYPTTASMIPELEQGLFVIPTIILIIYAGELVWNERARRMDEIVDSTALPNWAYAVPKTAAVTLVLASIFSVAILASIAVQLSLGFTRLEIGRYLLWYLLPATADMLILTVLAIFVQAVSPHKIVGWGIMLLFLFARQSDLMPDHLLLNYGAVPSVPLSDFIGADNFWVGAWILRLYWGALAVVLLVAAHLLWRRGTDISLRHRLRLARRRLAGAPGWIAAAALLTFGATGAYGWYNINVVNDYRSQEAAEARLALFEKKYGKYRDLPQPEVTDVRIDVALFPEERRAEARGRYTLRNVTDRPIGEVHLRSQMGLVEIAELAVAGGRLVSDDSDFGYRIYRLDRPMLPGEERAMTFRTVRARRGFADGQPDQKLVENGTYLDNSDLAPSIGFEGAQVLQGSARAKYGLPEAPRPARPDDESAYRKPGFGGAWAKTDIRLSTAADQVPIATGRKVSDVTGGGRRTARFVSVVPVHNFFSVHSGRYAERHRLHRGRDLAVYYHPAHAWNVDRMLSAMAASLDYYETAYGPYPFSEARLVEFGWAYYARAFPGTIPYSEDLGFVADLTDPDTIDNVSGVVGHELGHHYWGHQLYAAPMQGAELLSEPLATYSATMVLRRLRGPDEFRRLSQIFLDRYLGGRDAEAEELPLARVEGQNYIHSSKGPLALYLLAERLGEERVNRALRNMLERFRFRSDLYPRSTDLIAAFRAEARTAEEQALITDLFERITLYDFEAGEAKAALRADGRWQVEVPVTARKLYADGKGRETEVPLSERIEIGLFAAAPGGGPLDRGDVIAMQRRPVRSGRQTLRFVVDRKPLFAGIDPYNLYIDRDAFDNVAGVSEK
ncbi:MAG TPA: aminopeptidase [Allosphingosinicella sp.]|nr:aminopeptidase [Allosphingosinicella sp.]